MQLLYMYAKIAGISIIQMANQHGSIIGCKSNEFHASVQAGFIDSAESSTAKSNANACFVCRDVWLEERYSPFWEMLPEPHQQSLAFVCEYCIQCAMDVTIPTISGAGNVDENCVICHDNCFWQCSTLLSL